MQERASGLEAPGDLQRLELEHHLALVPELAPQGLAPPRPYRSGHHAITQALACLSDLFEGRRRIGRHAGPGYRSFRGLVDAHDGDGPGRR